MLEYITYILVLAQGLKHLKSKFSPESVDFCGGAIPQINAGLGTRAVSPRQNQGLVLTLGFLE